MATKFGTVKMSVVCVCTKSVIYTSRVLFFFGSVEVYYWKQNRCGSNFNHSFTNTQFYSASHCEIEDDRGIVFMGSLRRSFENV